MDKNTQKKVLLGVLGVIVLGAGSYFFLGRESTSSPAQTSTKGTTARRARSEHESSPRGDARRDRRPEQPKADRVPEPPQRVREEKKKTKRRDKKLKPKKVKILKIPPAG